MQIILAIVIIFFIIGLICIICSCMVSGKSSRKEEKEEDLIKVTKIEDSLYNLKYIKDKNLLKDCEYKYSNYKLEDELVYDDDFVKKEDKDDLQGRKPI